MRDALARGGSAAPRSSPCRPRNAAPAAAARLSVVLLLGMTCASLIYATDWPEWRGTGRDGIWSESGILDRFPDEGLTFTWRTSIRGGYAGPAVANGRVFVTDFERQEATRGIERVLALDERTGGILWTHRWPVDYAGLMEPYALGPRATPTVDGGRVYVQGAMGSLICLDARSGAVIWQKDYVKDYGAQVPVWGMVGAPLVEGKLLIALVGGRPDAKVVAFDKKTGREVWHALSSDFEPGYASPIIVETGGARQLIIWHPNAVASLDPASGKLFWEQPFDVEMGMTVATPVYDGGRLLVSSFFNGSMLLSLDVGKPSARLVWKGKSDSEIETDGLHALISTPFFDDGEIYGICSYGQLRALDAETGERLWESQQAVGEKARWASGLMVRNADRYFINNDRGELIIASLSPRGYDEVSRTKLLAPTSAASRRELGAVLWSHPAYANGHIVVRNDEEIVRADLRKKGR